MPSQLQVVHHFALLCHAMPCHAMSCYAVAVLLRYAEFDEKVSTHNHSLRFTLLPFPFSFASDQHST